MAPDDPKVLGYAGTCGWPYNRPDYKTDITEVPQMRKFVFATMMAVMMTIAAVPVLAQDGTGTAAAIQSPSDMLKESDNLWKKRNISGNAQKSFDIAEAALKAGGDEFEARWRMARGAFWVAERTSDKKLKETMGWRGYDEGLKASKLQPGRVEGYYFGVISLGQYSIAIGVLKAIGKGVKGKFESMGNKAVAVNPNFDFGGPDRAMGVYWRDLPKIARDLKKAEAHMKASIAKGDVKIRSHFYLAEIYLMTDRREMAKVELERCSKMDPAAEDYADGVMFRKNCADLLKKEFPAAP